MNTKLISAVIILMSIILLSGCGASSANRTMKVYEADYPEGISVSMYNAKIQKNIVVSDARMAFGKNKSQVRFVLNNRSKRVYNLVVNSEWSDKRGTIISSAPRPQNIRLAAKSGKRMVLNAPNYKAKDVIINIECGSNCIEKE
jgi:uncharacterized protein YcfL